MHTLGVALIFVFPAVILLLLASAVGVWRLLTRGTKSAATAVVRIVVYGGFILFILFFVVIGVYYANGGH